MYHATCVQTDHTVEWLAHLFKAAPVDSTYINTEDVSRIICRIIGKTFLYAA
jgi:hypothetical protein